MSNRSMGRAAPLAVLLLAVPVLAHGWGQEGHRVIATLAAKRLSPAARSEAAALLRLEPRGRTLAAVSMWADGVRYRLMPETYRWHFVNIPLTRGRYDPGRDCRRLPGKGDCIIAALARIRDALADTRRSQADRLEALKFVVHLAGDLHQPLHIAERDGDRGGTKVEVRWLGQRDRSGRKRQPWTLHAVWDGALIRETGRSATQYVVHLDRWLATQDERSLAAGDIVDWAMEAHEVARTQTYRSADGRSLPARGARLGRDYYQARIGAVDRQLASAGVRLARLLNETLR